MEEILSKLYETLYGAFQENLKPKDTYYFSDGKIIDVLKTLLSLSKTNTVLNGLMLKGAISIDELNYINKDGVNNCFDNQYIIKGNSINNDKVFIGVNGIFKFYTINNLDFKEALIGYDQKNFRQEKTLELKSQEKVWCIFLLLFGAHNLDNCFNTEGLTLEQLKKYHYFLIRIEKEMENQEINLGKKIGWETGKDSVFRKFITNNVDLPKTSLYFKKGSYQYYLDLSKRKNARYLLDLILNKYEPEERIMVNDLFYDSLKELSSSMPKELGQMPGKLNKYLIEELKGY